METGALQVLQVTTLDTGGAWKVVKRLEEAFDQLEIDVEKVVLAPTNNFVKRKIYNFFSKLDIIIATKSNSILTFSQFRALGTKFLLNQHKSKILSADVIHLHWLPGLLKNQITFLEKSRLIWTIHDFEAFSGGCHQNYGCLKFQGSCDSCPQILQIYHHDVEESLSTKITNVDHFKNLIVVSPSKWLASKIEKSSVLGGSEIYVIGNPIPIEIFNSAGSPRQFEKNKLTIGLLGSNYPQGKGASASLEILDRFRRRFSGDINLVIFGSPHPGFSGDSVAHGSSDQEIARNLKKCDFFLYYSTGETFGNFVAEAAACGVIVVSSASTALAELIEDGKTGLIVGVDSGNDLEKFHILANDEVKRLEMSRRAEDFIKTNFNSQKIANKYLELYKKK